MDVSKHIGPLGLRAPRMLDAPSRPPRPMCAGPRELRSGGLFGYVLAIATLVPLALRIADPPAPGSDSASAVSATLYPLFSREFWECTTSLCCSEWRADQIIFLCLLRGHPSGDGKRMVNFFGLGRRSATAL